MSAYAFARFEGKRLPTSLEWEAAAREATLGGGDVGPALL
ncbi:MAG: SUMF1/EgtB/PvdO family nonheme iron enzyme, partial [Streptosporangiaceae bacterium]